LFSLQIIREFEKVQGGWMDGPGFSGTMPSKFEHKLRRHKQRFDKITTTAVLDKKKIFYDQCYDDIGVVIATK